MSTNGRQRSPQSWEHLLEKDPYTGTGFRLGIVAAVLIHAGIFAISWPTVAQVPSAEPEEVLIPFPITNLRPPEREPEPIRIEVPERPQGSVIIPEPPRDPIEPIERPHEEVMTVPDAEFEYVPAPDDVETTADIEQARIVLVGVDIAPPKVLVKIEPRYTQPAIKAGVKGAVILDLIIDTEGRVESVTVLRGLPLGLTTSAIDAVEQWRFEASTFNNHPVAVRYILTIHFNLT